MKRILFSATAPILFALPFLAAAQGGIANDASGGPFGDLLENILTFSNNVLIPFILGIGFLVFVFGVFYYFIAGGANDEKKEKGRSLIIYSILAFVLIIIFWGVINLLVASLGLQEDQLEDIPTTGVTL
jgi:hypothetical protein